MFDRETSGPNSAIPTAAYEAVQILGTPDFWREIPLSVIFALVTEFDAPKSQLVDSAGYN